MANLLLKEADPTRYTPVGVNWVGNFVGRHKDLRTCLARKISYKRAECENPRVVKAYFDQLQKVRIQYGIMDDDIYNFDETGFAMGILATARVISRREETGKPRLVQPDNQEWVTTIECINSSGWALPTTIIFKGRLHLEGWYQGSNLPPDWRIEVSPNGWTTDEIGLRWLQKVFIPSSQVRKVGRYRLLILDGHGSHLTPEFDRICTQADIIPFCMPPGSSHLLQPLDIGCFGPLKRAYGGLVEGRMRLGYSHIDKHDFLKAYMKAHCNIFTPQNIQNSFAAAGIRPLNARRVLDNLNISLPAPSTPKSGETLSISSSALAPPRTVRQLQKKASPVRKILGQGSRSPSSPSKRAVNQLEKAAELALYSAAQLTDEVNKLRAANIKGRQEKKGSKQQMAPNHGLSIQEARDLIAQRNEAQTIEEVPVGFPTPLYSDMPRRAPPTCSECNIQGHTRVRCPTRHVL
jgi:hypothetical protein